MGLPGEQGPSKDNGNEKNGQKEPCKNKESLVRGYMAGRYGAIPFIPEDLTETEESVPHGEE